MDVGPQRMGIIRGGGGGLCAIRKNHLPHNFPSVLRQPYGISAGVTGATPKKKGIHCWEAGQKGEGSSRGWGGEGGGVGAGTGDTDTAKANRVTTGKQVETGRVHAGDRKQAGQERLLASG